MGQHIFTPQAGFISDLNSIPTYLTCCHRKRGVLRFLSRHVYDHTQSGWVADGNDRSPRIVRNCKLTPTVTVTPSLSSLSSTQP